MFRENRDKEKKKKEPMCSKKKRERVLDGGRCKIIKKLRKNIILIKKCV